MAKSYLFEADFIVEMNLIIIIQRLTFIDVLNSIGQVTISISGRGECAVHRLIAKRNLEQKENP